MTRRKRARLLGLSATVVLVVVAILAPRTIAAGWLIGFASVGAVILGADGLLLTHALTGGRWGTVNRLALTAAAGATPLVFVGFLVLIAVAPLIYPWFADPAQAGNGVAALYLNLVLFAVRGAVLIAGLALLSRLDRRSGLGRLTAGIGLVWYVVGMDFAAVDWLQSVEPRYTSSAFGAQIIIQQFLAALAWTILVMPPNDDGAQWNDLGSLLLATSLGESYLILMTLVVHWYGDQPHQAAWYLRRTEHGWIWLELAGVLVGSAGPIIALLFAAVRHRARPLKIVALASLAGVLIENIWLVAPSTTAWAGLTGPLVTLAAGALAVGFAPSSAWPDPQTREVAHGL